MAKNNSFRNFKSFSATINNSNANADHFNDDTLAATMKDEHKAYIEQQTAYDEWAKATLLADSISPIGGLKFADLFAMEVGDLGQNVMVFNPKGTEGSSWSKNCGGMVNALLTAFGTHRYYDLRHGHHARRFDKSLVIEHNVLSAFDDVAMRWNRYDWNNRRFTVNTPWIARPEGAAWLSKHTEIDRMILALLGNQQIRYNFLSPKDDVSWERFNLNVLSNMQSTVEKVNTQLANQAEGAQLLRKIERDNNAGETKVTPTSVIVDGVDLKQADGTVLVEIKMDYSANPVRRPVSAKNAQSIEFVANTMADKHCEYVKLVK